MKDQHKQSDSLTASRRNPTSRKALPKLTLRIDFDADRAIGPGKVKLLEMIDRHGSISEAGRQMGMSYRPEGQAAIGAYKVAGDQLFHPSATAPK
jgi:hypothetical protein